MPFTSQINHSTRVYNLSGGIESQNPFNIYDSANDAPIYATDRIRFVLSDTNLGSGTPQFPIVQGDQFGFYVSKSQTALDYDAFYSWTATLKSGSVYNFSKSFTGFDPINASQPWPPGFSPNPDNGRTNLSMSGSRDYANVYLTDQPPENFPFGDWRLKLFFASDPADVQGDGSGTVSSSNFQMRGIAIKDFEAECPFVDVLSKDPVMRVSGKITVFPNMTNNNIAGWTPTEDIQYQVAIKHDSLPGGEFRLPVRTLDKNNDITAPDNDGVVATFTEEWNGQIAPFQFCLDNVEVICRAIMPTATGNTITPEASTRVTFNFCGNNEKNGIFRLGEILSFFNSPIGAVQAGINYLSSKLKDSPASMGYGWFSTENIKIYPIDGDNDLVYCDESGNCHRWIKNGSNYESLLTNQRLDIEVNPSGGDEYYRVRTRDREVRTFNAAGELKKQVDRNNNVTSFDDTPVNRFTVTGPKGRKIHYHFDELPAAPGEYELQPCEISTSQTKGDTSPGVRSYKFTYTSSPDKRVETIENPVGDVTRFSYDSAGRLLTKREERPTQGDRLVTYTYAGDGRTESVTVSSFTTDVTTVEIPHYRATYIYEQPFRFPVDGVDVDFIVTEMLVEDLEDLTNKDRVIKIASDVLGRTIAEFELVEDDDTEPDSYRAVFYTYNDPTDPANPSDSDDIYLVSQVDSYNGIEKRSTTTYEYTQRGNPRRIVDDQGNETKVLYVEEDPNADPVLLDRFPDYPVEIRRPSPDGMAMDPVYYEPTKFTYHPTTGNLLTVRDANLDGGSQGQLTTMTYNGQGQIETVTNRNGFLRIFEYSMSTANLIDIYVEKNSTPSNNPNAPSTRPNEFRRYTIGYDAFDNITSVVDSNNVLVQLDYDEIDRLVKTVTKPDAADIETLFHYEDRVLKALDLPSVNVGASASGIRTTDLLYDQLGRLEEIRRDVSASILDQTRVAFSYDGFGQAKTLSRLKDINGTPTLRSFETEYDRLGRPSSSKDPRNKTSTMAYEKYCTGHALTTARGVRRRTSFDSLCRLTKLQAGTPSVSDDMAVATVSETRDFIYDDLGRLIESRQSGGAGGSSGYGSATYGTSFYGSQAAGTTETREYYYDPLDRLTRLIFEDDKEMHFEYDYEDNVTKVTENASGATPLVTDYTYLGDNRLNTVTFRRSGGVGDRTFSYNYDPGGRLQSITYPLGTGLVAYYTWDGRDQLKSIRYEKGMTNLRQMEYTYDDAGNLATFKDVPGSGMAKLWVYEYDYIGRLIKVSLDSEPIATAANLDVANAQTQRMYAYDASDNRTELNMVNINHVLTYSYNEADDITERFLDIGSGPVSVENFNSDDDGNLISRTSGGITTSYNYTDFNRLDSIEVGATTKQTNAFWVNGFRRKKKDENNNESTEYSAALATAVAKTQTESYTYLMGHQILGFERQSDGEMYFALSDHLSSFRDLVDNQGSVVQSYDFDEWGNHLAGSGQGTVSSPKTYVGGMSMTDESGETGLHLAGHRFADLTLGRFLNRDPIGFAGGLNLLGYAGGANSPVNMLDYTGLQEGSPRAGDRKYSINHPPEAYHEATTEEIIDTAVVVSSLYGVVGLARLGFGVLGHTLIRYGAGNVGMELIAVSEGAAVTTAAGTAGAATTSRLRGASSPRLRASAFNGNEMHYDCLNGGRGFAASGIGAPSQLQRRYPDTLFRFTRRGEKGADVYYVGGQHPSSYPGSSWPRGVDVADFKPYTSSGLKAVPKEIRAGKLPPDTFPIFYEPNNGVLRVP